MKDANQLTLEQAVGHLLCPLFSHSDLDQLKRWQERDHYGAAFFNRRTFENLREVTGALQSAAEVPIVVAGDLENGAGKSVADKSTQFPWIMGCSAANNEAAIFQMGQAAGLEGRNAGFHWTFAPVVDLNYNFRNGETNIRSFGDDPERVLRLARAYAQGVQSESRMASCAKHFPGAGMDERDQHLVTSINSLSVEAWMATYGKVWRGMIEADIWTVMPGHISFPAWQGFADDPAAALPASLCPKLLTDLLRQELGFTGMIVSDAATMVGIQSRASEDDAVVRFIEAGGDSYLFAEPEKDYDRLMSAVKSGRLSEARVYESAQRVLDLKNKLNLFDDVYGPEPTAEQAAELTSAAQSLADQSIVIERDNGKVGLAPSAGAKVLTITLNQEGHKFLPVELEDFDAALTEAGYDVTHLLNPGHHDIIKVMDQYETIFLNFYIVPHMVMGHTRLYSANAMTFWRGFYTDHADVRCSSFGTPYILFDQPHLPNLLQAYGASPMQQRVAVDVWLGKKPALGTSPVRQPRVTIKDQPHDCIA